MTASVATPELKIDGDPLRILSITANLLPIEITDARREHKLRWLVAAMLAVVLVALGFWDYSARQTTADQQKVLDTTNSKVNSLQQSMNDPQLAGISKVKAADAAISAQLATLMARDIAWYNVIPAVRTTAAGAGVTLTNIGATLSTASSAAAAPAAPVAGAAAATTDAGTITLIGQAPDKPQVAAFLDAIAKVPGLGTPVLANINSLTGGYQFAVSVTFTSALYSGRFTPATSTGGK